MLINIKNKYIFINIRIMPITLFANIKINSFIL